MKTRIIWSLIAVLAISSCTSKKEDNKLNLRLKWAYQAQFAGYLVAKDKGFYKDAGVDINIQPAGPDLKPYSTVASGSDDVGIGIISQLLTARSNQVPIIAFAQIFQDSPNRFVLKKQNSIHSLKDLKGKKVGLWMGGDEIEFITMLKSQGMSMKDIDVVPQKFSVAPFLRDAYVCSQVMVYNELNQIEDAGYKPEDLQIISPKDYHAAILGDLLFTNEKFMEGHEALLQRFLAASIKGWEYAKAHPQEAVNITLKYNHELDAKAQGEQLQAVLAIIFNKVTAQHGMGYIDPAEYDNAKKILLDGMDPSTADYQSLSKVDVSKSYTTALLSK